MNPSDAGGGPTHFDWWSSIWIPSIGILAAIIIPISILYWQRWLDKKQRITLERKSALRTLVFAIAPLLSADPRFVDVRQMLVDLRTTAMEAVDAYPSGHPAQDLIGWYHIWGTGQYRLVSEELAKPRYANANPDEVALALSGMARWAASYTTDVRYLASAKATDEETAEQARTVQAQVRDMHEKHGWGEPGSHKQWTNVNG